MIGLGRWSVIHKLNMIPRSAINPSLHHTQTYHKQSISLLVLDVGTTWGIKTTYGWILAPAGPTTRAARKLPVRPAAALASIGQPPPRPKQSNVTLAGKQTPHLSLFKRTAGRRTAMDRFYASKDPPSNPFVIFCVE